MRTHLRFVTSVVALVGVLSCAVAATQQPSVEQPAKRPNPFGESPGPLVPLRVQIVVARYQDGKKVSSLPYTLTVTANDGIIQPGGQFQPFSFARLRAGADVPVASTVVTTAQKDSVTPAPSPAQAFSYRSIGTNIDCSARSVDSARYAVNISIEDQSVYPSMPTVQGSDTTKDTPSFRTFTSRNSVILRDGQSVEFTAAADKITAEETRITVTIAVVK